MTEDGRQKAEVCPERNRRNRRQRTEDRRQKFVLSAAEGTEDRGQKAEGRW